MASASKIRKESEEPMAICDFSHNSLEDRIFSVLDSIEKRVESLRNQAMMLETEREDVLKSLHKLQNAPELLNMREGERQDIHVNSERLICRCLTVDVLVTTPRDRQQEAALKDVHKLLSELEEKIRTDFEGNMQLVKTYLNACLNQDGPVNEKFQNVLISCTADDQKKVRSKLEMWYKTLSTSHSRFPSANNYRP